MKQENSNNTPKQCSFCNSEVPIGERRCPSCGSTNFVAPKPNVEVVHVVTVKKKRPIGCFVILFVLIAAAIIVPIVIINALKHSPLNQETILSAARNASYEIVETNNYDGIGTYRAKISKTSEASDEPLFTILVFKSSSKDAANLKYFEHTIYVDEINGNYTQKSGSNYNSIEKENNTHYGLLYKVDDITLHVIADIQYKNEIKAFLISIGCDI